MFSIKTRYFLSFFEVVIKGCSWSSKPFLVSLSITANLQLLYNKSAIFWVLWPNFWDIRILVCNVRRQFRSLIFLRDTEYIMLGTSNQVKSNNANLYCPLHIQMQDKEIVGSYRLSEIKRLAHLLYNRAHKCSGVKAIAKIATSTNIAILIMWYLSLLNSSPRCIQYDNKNL